MPEASWLAWLLTALVLAVLAAVSVRYAALTNRALRVLAERDARDLEPLLVVTINPLSGSVRLVNLGRYPAHVSGIVAEAAGRVELLPISAARDVVGGHERTVFEPHRVLRPGDSVRVGTLESGGAYLSAEQGGEAEHVLSVEFLSGATGFRPNLLVAYLEYDRRRRRLSVREQALVAGGKELGKTPG